MSFTFFNSPSIHFGFSVAITAVAILSIIWLLWWNIVVKGWLKRK